MRSDSHQGLCRRMHIESLPVLSVTDFAGHVMVVRGGTRLIGVAKWNSHTACGMAADFELMAGAKDGFLMLRLQVHAGPGATRPYRLVELELAAQPMRFGGVRWWFVCPVTGQHAMKLYFAKEDARFRSRAAFSPLPSYQCQRLSGIRALIHRQRQHRRRTEMDSDLAALPARPKWMRWRTFERNAYKDLALEELTLAAIDERERRGLERLDRRVRQTI